MELRHNFIPYICVLLSLFAANSKVEAQHRRGDIEPEAEIVREVAKLIPQANSGKDDVPPQGASTLTFVFDVTGSMYDDLQQVIEGAAKILKTTLENRDKILYNYALVPFHDPQIGPITITTDPIKFQRDLRDLYVQGGGDCPEMSVGAIEQALQISLPSSFIYVFTDARSKDYNVTENVLKLIQEKQSQVVFVMTGDCGNRSHVGFKVYEQIAATSSGQLFMLNKSDVDQVLNFVRLSVQSRKVYLVNLNDISSGSKTHIIPVDPALREITVSVSGDNPSIHLEDPMGRIITKADGLMNLLSINNGRVVSLKTPKPGLWKLIVNSDSTHTVRVTGLSSLDFVPGYSRSKVVKISLTRQRPIAGIPMHLILNATGLDPPGAFTKVELVNYKGETIREFPLQRNRSNPSLYIVPKFLPPDEFFFVRVTGYDKENYKFLRLNPAAVTPEIPTTPVVSMAERTAGYYGQVATLTCHVDSLVPYSVQWTKNRLALAPLLFIDDSTSVTFNISNANALSEGYYECSATNPAGRGKATTFLDVTEPPPDIEAPHNVSVLPGGTVVLSCEVFSSVQFNMTWSKPGSLVALSRHTRVTLRSDNALEIRDATQGDNGHYRCTASNEGGSTSKDIFLMVQEMPTVSVSSRNITFRAGDNITVSCSARGFPSPNLEWRKGDLPLHTSERIQITEQGDLKIYNAAVEDSGLYACVAVNPAGTDGKGVHITYIEGPRVRITERRVLVQHGTTGVLHCPAEGIPPPVISWYRNGFLIGDAGFTSVRPNGDLEIVGVQETDSGDYTCIARNDAGTDNGVVTLLVGDIPSFLQQPLDVRINIGMNVTWPCVGYGFPDPQTTWYKVDGDLDSNERATVTADGSLFIRNVGMEDEGTYVCVIENEFGRKEESGFLRITGVVRPVIAFSNPQLTAIKGTSLTITCQILTGNPPPTITWSKEGIAIDFDNSPFMEHVDDGSLVISGVDLSHAGEYTCLASNFAGKSSFISTVSVIDRPTIGDSPGHYTAVQYTSVVLACPVDGLPPPHVTWQKGGQIISRNDPYFYISESGSLHIPRVHARDSGVYTCMASNPAGVDSKDIRLNIQVPPSVTGFTDEISVKVGSSVDLPCEVQSVPPPTISWRRGDQKISSNNLHFSVQSSGSLTISNVRREDSGVFTCVATNVAGNVTTEVFLKVNVPPTILPGSDEIIGTVGSPVILPCESEGEPGPTVSWTKNNRGIDVLTQGNLLLETGSLQIANVQPTDGGVYRCKVTNVAGTDQRVVTLIVQEPPIISDDIPDFIEAPPGYAVVLQCPATGFPRPEIKWLKDGVELDSESQDIRVWSDGSLSFRNPKEEDSGDYTCVAFNPAGNHTKIIKLKIHVLPTIKKGPHEVSTIVDHSVLLECEANGDPFPTVTWKKNGRRLALDPMTMQQLNSGSLQISSTSKEYAGRYTCIATNIAGSARKDIVLIVLEPPAIGRASKLVEVDEDERIILPCPVSGYPRPDITWYKNDGEIGFNPAIIELETGSLMITVAQSEDSGEYKCVAANEVGNATHIVRVNVRVGPTISDGPVEINVPIGQPVTLPCEASGDPSPTVTWEKSSSVISIDGKSFQLLETGSLHISSARHADTGRYTCIVSNVVSTAVRNIQVNVQESPTIIPGPYNGNISATAGDEIIIPCRAEGTPAPTIEWYKDDQKLTGYEPDLEIREDGSLRIFMARPSDRGTYTCHASNRGGTVTFFNKLVVNVEPYITGIILEEVRSILGNPVILPCDAHGDPTPVISWQKEGATLIVSGQSRRILETGSLQIDSTRDTDSGQYTCTAVNIAGDVAKIIILVVDDPPRISQDTSRNVTAVVNSEGVLHCRATGIPRPQIVWLKNGNEVRLYGDDVVQLSDGSLYIKAAQPIDSGIYTCMASNRAGNTTINVDFTVFVAPRIPGSETPTEVSIIPRGPPLMLECPVDENAVPVPGIYWLKDGTPISERQHGIMITSGGRLLQINDVQITDAGRYTCNATSPAGSDSKIYDVIVLVPPSIDDSDLPKHITGKEGHSVTLDCDATGIPPPRLTWLKNGVPITPNDRGIRITNRGKHLHINYVEEFHQAQYTCHASNIAGNVTRIINFNVQTKPDIEGEETQVIEVIQNNAVGLQCPADSNPAPTITWYKGGKRISLWERGMRILRRNTLLQIYSAQVADSGSYWCVAVNRVGNDTKTFELKVLVPPMIEEDKTYIAVPVDSDVYLPCQVTGMPEPKVTWHKGEIKLSANIGRYLFHDHGSLSINAVGISDSGEYVCHASNKGGNVTRIITLEVHVKPSIQPTNTDVKANIHDTVTLQCPAVGTPTPMIIWQKGVNVLHSDTPGYRVGSDGSLTIESAKLSDAGSYMCYARSVAGLDQKRIHLSIFVAPTIAESYQHYLVNENQLINLECTATGTPRPRIRWQREHVDISENSIRYRPLPNGHLQIPFAREEDTGMFKCIAENEGGRAEQLMNLQVQVPPSIAPTKQEFFVDINENIGLPCVANGIPDPTISWAKDGLSVDTDRYIVSRDGTLRILRAQEQDSGSYVCTAINVVGRDSVGMILTVQVPPRVQVTPNEQEVSVNGKIQLECEANGVPEPDIIWLHEGIRIPARRGEDGKTVVVINNARMEDGGTYECYAENPAGYDRRVVGVRIKTPPIFTEEPDSRVATLQNVVTFPCTVGGDPKPHIQWLKNGLPLAYNHRYFMHNNGSLTIYNTVSADTGNYTCQAINEEGNISVNAELRITVRPEFTLKPPDNVIVDLGGILMLDCAAKGPPDPAIEWWSENGMIVSGERRRILANNSLMIVDARLSDAGRISCMAINTMGATADATNVTVRVHGEWSEWQKWGACSETCGKGSQIRTRTCNNPQPANGGRPCPGKDTEDKVCNQGACPINGQWGDWIPWEPCTKTCGQGTRSRTRLCNSPPPQYGGRSCQGSAYDQQLCNIKPCPVDGSWGAWLPWQECSETCGEGTKIRMRSCNNPAPRDGGFDCPGLDTQSQMCKIRDCSVDGKWSSWSGWSMCSKSCGTGERFRTRRCSEPAPQNGGRYCEGNDQQTDYCNTDGCPVHGGWSTWEEWGDCSSSCNGGQQKRYRSCNNPRPLNGGRNCADRNVQMKACNLHQCPIDGGWAEWGEWTQCTQTCGEGSMTRYRTCSNPEPRSGGRSCPGDESQRTRCNTNPCPAAPKTAVAFITGNLNDINFVAPLFANISLTGDGRLVNAEIHDLPDSLGYWMRQLVSLLTPIYWTSAYEIGEAVNGYTLTEGYFVRQTQVEFASGEVLTMIHNVNGLRQDGVLEVEVVIDGEVPSMEYSTDITLKPYTEDYIQTGPGEIYAYSYRMFSADGHHIPYAWTHTINYDPSRGRMPFMVEKLYAKDLGVQYDPFSRVLEFQIVTSIAKGEPSNECPEGFNMDPSGLYCKDEDECSRQRVCSHTCHNKPGGFTCSCPDGMMLDSDRQTCTDVDECKVNNGGCPSGHDCVNTEGSFTCIVKCRKGLVRSTVGPFCIDVNECRQLRNLCEHYCENTIGSYKCYCQRGYELEGIQGRCRDINECEVGNPCPPGKSCENTQGSYRCINLCPSGFQLARNGSCVDVDECMSRQDRCSYNQVCRNTEGSYACLCPRGYRANGMGQPCLDVNECSENRGLCSYQCRNLPGTYECICPPGQKRLADRKGCAGLSWDDKQAFGLAETQFDCEQGTQYVNGQCEDINECENPQTCQHECVNTEGSYYCRCPQGYTLSSDGKTCQDIDECLEQNIDCGTNRMCFNKLGGYECIDTPCPPGYERKVGSGYCVRNCPYPKSLCTSDFEDILEYRTVALPKGILGHQDLIRLVTLTQDGNIHPRSNYRLIDNRTGMCGCTCDCSNQVPFDIRLENGKGVVYTLEPLRDPKTYQMQVQATGYNDWQIEYQTTFVIYISVSNYPY